MEERGQRREDRVSINAYWSNRVSLFHHLSPDTSLYKIYSDQNWDRHPAFPALISKAKRMIFSRIRYARQIRSIMWEEAVQGREGGREVAFIAAGGEVSTKSTSNSWEYRSTIPLFLIEPQQHHDHRLANDQV